MEDDMKNGGDTCQTEKHPNGQEEEGGFNWDSDDDGSQSTKDANGEGAYSDVDGDAYGDDGEANGDAYGDDGEADGDDGEADGDGDGEADGDGDNDGEADGDGGGLADGVNNGDGDWDEEGSCPLVSGSPVTIRVEPEIMTADGEDFIWDPEEDASPPHQSPTSSGSGMSYGCGCCGQQFAHLRQLMEHMAQHAPPNSQAGAGPVAVAVSHSYPLVQAQAATSEPPPLRYTLTQPAQPPPLAALPLARPLLPRPTATLVQPQEFGFACMMCGKVFARQGHLAMHCRLGHGVQAAKGWGLKVASTTFLQQVAKEVDRPFECQLCQKRFVRKHHLQAHLRSHSGIKPFNCPLCGKALSSKQSVGIHLRQHEPVPPVTRQPQPILPMPASRPQ